ncbi:NAD(P)/FAD-dependent oxidoreductase [Rhabdaerophilum calidifontis]|uniref:NAD(P)/FAD-dependent oxidoreductase n=1 Tax=Rhabdaerophilum calidifontis TaxID=2604328 RepID=UPI00123B32B2|nr:NAD(P)/FAD-dependent oxidoreductase [Rhabdaerophilum calidifontis]
MINRRQILAGAAALTGTLAAPMVRAQGKPRVVVVGGGAGGATAAKYIAKDSQGAIKVTLVEPKDTFTTCFHSNLYLGGFKSFDEITHRYDKLASAYGIRHVRQWATAVDRSKREIVLADGSRLGYDRLVLAPGIDLKYDSVPGWGKDAEEVMPHAWLAGPQTQLLRRQLDAVKDGGVIVMIAPPNPFRCPPGPYERVSMMAHQLKASGRTRAKIFVLDPKESFSKQGLFQQGWERHYPGMVEWIGPKVHDGIKSVDPKTMTVTTGFETYRDCALVNVIPAQSAGRIARDAGLANASGYCPIDPESMKSTLDPAIFIIGDASIAGDMPKSGFSANSQAKVAAMAIRGELTNSRTFPARYANTCWSLIAPDDTVKVGGRYEPKPDKITAAETFISKTDETAEYRRQVQQENIGWYAGIVADMFT